MNYEDMREPLTNCDEWNFFDEDLMLTLKMWESLYGEFKIGG